MSRKTEMIRIKIINPIERVGNCLLLNGQSGTFTDNQDKEKRGKSGEKIARKENWIKQL